jgi:hypothetical protein
MPKFFNKWQTNPLAFPNDPAAIMKINMALLEMVKADFKSGKLKDWGVTADGINGYAIAECSEAEIFVMMLKYSPYIISEIKPIFTVDESIEIAKAMIAAAAGAPK